MVGGVFGRRPERLEVGADRLAVGGRGRGAHRGPPAAGSPSRSHPRNRRAIRAYLETLWPAPEDAPAYAHVVVWEKAEKSSRWFRLVDGLGPVVDHLHRVAATTDAYVAVAALDGRAVPPPERASHRGKAEHALLVPALYLDVDVAGPGHVATDLPATAGAALAALAEDFLPRPTMVVATGGGLHLYWCLKEPLELGDEVSRVAAATLLGRLQLTVQTHWRRRGWRLDAVAELARVLRPAGTLNHKVPAAPRPTSLRAADGGARWPP